MSKNIEWEKIKEDMKKAINLTIDQENYQVEIEILDKELIDKQLSGNLIQSEASLQQLLKGYVEDKTINPKITINQETNRILLDFDNQQDAQTIYNFFEKFFFGDILKTMIEALFGAFGGMYGSDG
ncbi:MAG: hypothetical protein GF311_25340 [Candidatus Lokiarchaeota archaeon]|nr:hypothetical protein [Candidatus Lokiarchaeota archaeon]